MKTTKTEYLVEVKEGSFWCRYDSASTDVLCRSLETDALNRIPYRRFRRVKLTTVTTVKRRVIK